MTATAVVIPALSASTLDALQQALSAFTASAQQQFESPIMTECGAKYVVTDRVEGDQRHITMLVGAEAKRFDDQLEVILELSGSELPKGTASELLPDCALGIPVATSHMLTFRVPLKANFALPARPIPASAN